jgi:hypothetical protein
MIKTKIEKIKFLEIITILASLIGIFLSLSHGNLYDYFLDMFTIEGFAYIKMLYLSLLVYSALSFVVFFSLYLLNEKNNKIRIINYLQGWTFIIMAVFSFEWLDSLMIWSTQNILLRHFIEYPFTLPTKGASVIFFSALFLFWVLENKKHSLR